MSRVFDFGIEESSIARFFYPTGLLSSVVSSVKTAGVNRLENSRMLPSVHMFFLGQKERLCTVERRFRLR